MATTDFFFYVEKHFLILSRLRHQTGHEGACQNSSSDKHYEIPTRKTLPVLLLPRTKTMDSFHTSPSSYFFQSSRDTCRSGFNILTPNSDRRKSVIYIVALFSVSYLHSAQPAREKYVNRGQDVDFVLQATFKKDYSIFLPMGMNLDANVCTGNFFLLSYLFVT